MTSPPCSLVVLVLLAAGLAAQDSRPSSRPVPQHSEAARRIKQPFEGPDLPGGDATRGWAWMPITEVPYVRPDAMLHPLKEEDIVIGITSGDVARAYPIIMLGGPQREIINDHFGDQPYAVNW